MGSVPSINSLDFGVFSCTYMYCHLTFIFGTCRYLYIFHLERLSQIILKQVFVLKLIYSIKIIKLVFIKEVNDNYIILLRIYKNK